MTYNFIWIDRTTKKTNRLQLQVANRLYHISNEVLADGQKWCEKKNAALKLKAIIFQTSWSNWYVTRNGCAKNKFCNVMNGCYASLTIEAHTSHTHKKKPAVRYNCLRRLNHHRLIEGIEFIVSNRKKKHHMDIWKHIQSGVRRMSCLQLDRLG